MIPLVNKQFVMFFGELLKEFFIYFLFVIYYYWMRKFDTHEMTVEDLSKEMKTNNSLIILDVRTTEELIGPFGKN